MRLMGITRLECLTKCGVDGMAEAVAALLSELAAARWRTNAEFLTQFPFASVGNGLVRIPMGKAHCVDLVLNYDAGFVLVAFAGATAERQKASKSGRQAA